VARAKSVCLAHRVQITVRVGGCTAATSALTASSSKVGLAVTLFLAPTLDKVVSSFSLCRGMGGTVCAGSHTAAAHPVSKRPTGAPVANQVRPLVAIVV